ncbi:MAG: GyrI-like domain-containing protein [Candidatus Nanopelagicales bacterium]
MTYEVSVEHQARQDAAIIRSRVTREAIPAFLGVAYAELFEVLGEQGLGPEGPPFARYRDDGDAFEVMAGVPVTAGMAATGRVEGGELPEADCATTVHVGSYDDLPDAFHAVIEWITANGRAIAADPWESYLDGPEVPEPRTKVCFPLRPVSG